MTLPLPCFIAGMLFWGLQAPPSPFKHNSDHYEPTALVWPHQTEGHISKNEDLCLPVQLWTICGLFTSFVHLLDTEVSSSLVFWAPDWPTAANVSSTLLSHVDEETSDGSRKSNTEHFIVMFWKCKIIKMDLISQCWRKKDQTLQWKCS